MNRQVATQAARNFRGWQCARVVSLSLRSVFLEVAEHVKWKSLIFLIAFPRCLSRKVTL